MVRTALLHRPCGNHPTTAGVLPRPHQNLPAHERARRTASDGDADTDYAIGHNILYVAFRWSKADHAREVFIERGMAHGVGVCEISETPVLVSRPAAQATTQNRATASQTATSSHSIAGIASRAAETTASMGNVESCCFSVQSLLHPASVKHVSAPCPACGAATAYRRDSAGELVRVPALQIVTETGCTCQVCRHTWGPGLFMHLARVLGFGAPTGVLE
ncbi:hypothetical protein Mkiyose1665_18330 [Mycobacterium kiyosense]|uniref:DUF7340 domain-containing protein n=1 Tax=Mycobacterium kiyosense TaxID=2871094 RepID=A0A9P3Q209_9MYCO|nr:hypothetical protein MKCMC460_23600 [Mycobacterium sp. 20KCMC460]GLB84162.1 hypothetical protein SRL2020028_34180 [Mycobacterium kiyosense]GLB88432.1 hypothetical protein SRL2020130_12490 [Mycobacterium kiyosense]GLB94642.1 hypothetical protein SRL2020226_14180 [Mycobacterium kiyosense]GLC01274.1 hypothetical protein SRL2020400_18650 [Mycobacterium kiyosense]